MTKKRYICRLSPAERQSVAEIGSNKLTEYMNKGDLAKKNGNYVGEASNHRYVQETLGGNGYVNRDDESLDSYSYNSAVLHVAPLVETGQKYGLTFERMFNYRLNENPDYSKKEKKHNYEWRVPEAIISTDGLRVLGMDQNRNSYFNEYIDILEKKKQVDNYNAKKYVNNSTNVNNITSDRNGSGFLSTTELSSMSAMDKWMDDYEKKNGLPRSFNHNTNGTNGTNQQRYENNSVNRHAQQSNCANPNNMKNMSSMDIWMDNYERRNGIPRSFNHNGSDFYNSNSNNFGIPRRTWD